MKQKKALEKSLCSTDKDFGERPLKIKLLKIIIVAGIFASIVGIIVNTYLGYPIYSVLTHVVGLALLSSMFIFLDNKISLETVSIIIFSYYCYIYSPLSWFYEGVYGSAPFTSFVFGAYIVLLLEGKIKKIFLISYSILLMILASSELIYIYSKDIVRGDKKYLIHNIGYFLMYFIFIYTLTVFKNLYDSHREKLRKLSMNDVLTGVYNRGYINKLLNENIEKYKIDNKNFSLIVCDLDEFKAINDDLGHDAGDKCLIGFADFIKESLGENGILGRIGGDEFIIIIPDKNKDETQVLAIDLINKLDEFYIDGIGRVLKMSIGISDIKESYNLDEIIKLADERMYISKKNKKKIKFFTNF